MQKVVISRCFDGFKISKECAEYMAALGDTQAQAELDVWHERKFVIDSLRESGVIPEGHDEYIVDEAKRCVDLGYAEPHFWGTGHPSGIHYADSGYKRDGEALVKAVEALGERASPSKLKIVEIPDGVEFHVNGFDGYEYVAENYRTWR